jgi:hemerythrin-like domain-containing protein
MKKHKPIKRSKAFVRFSKDHHFGLLLVWQIRQDVAKETATSQIAGYVQDFFENDLRGHFKEEEELIFSKLPARDSLRNQAETEHSKLYLLIDCIRKDKSDKRLLQQFADSLEAHIRFEERVLFNHLQEIMSPEDLEALILSTGSKESNGSLRNHFNAGQNA